MEVTVAYFQALLVRGIGRNHVHLECTGWDPSPQPDEVKLQLSRWRPLAPFNAEIQTWLQPQNLWACKHMIHVCVCVCVCVRASARAWRFEVMPVFSTYCERISSPRVIAIDIVLITHCLAEIGLLSGQQFVRAANVQASSETCRPSHRPCVLRELCARLAHDCANPVGKQHTQLGHCASSHSHTIFMRYVLILSSHLHLNLSSGFRQELCIHFISSSISPCYMSHRISTILSLSLSVFILPFIKLCLLY
jgi:hypothetical protein